MNDGPPSSPPRILEMCAAAHLGAFLVGVSWAFGGNADWVRTPLSLWGSLGALIAAAAILLGPSRALVPRGTVAWILPVLALNALVLVSCLTAGFRPVGAGVDPLLVPVRVDWWIPSSARPEVSLRALWLFDGIYFSCLNVALTVRRRRVIRILLALAVANALVLSVFGTIQKLVGADGIYFGLVKSPQVRFFASFVYNNHWGAFIVLMMGACIGLVLHYASGRHGEGFFRGPALAGMAAAALILLAVPLSGARACTFLASVLVVVALVRGVPRVARALRLSGLSPASSMAAMAAAAALVLAGFWAVAGDVIDARVQKTREQVSVMWARGGIGSRSVLYNDTLRMARERPLFGWGMGTFPMAFRIYNSQEPKLDRIPVIYHDAHSDWLQSLAEIGLAGTALIGAAVMLPALAVRRHSVSTIPYFLLSGCVLTALYAWVEFPFGNVAVVLAWWTCFFCAIQYMRLTEHLGADASPE